MFKKEAPINRALRKIQLLLIGVNVICLDYGMSYFLVTRTYLITFLTTTLRKSLSLNLV